MTTRQTVIIDILYVVLVLPVSPSVTCVFLSLCLCVSRSVY